MLVENIGRCVEIIAACDNFVEPIIVDLADIDGCIPGGEQRRGADAVADFRRERMHVVAKYRALVGISIEVEIAVLAGQPFLEGFEQHMTICNKRILAGPNPLDDLKARIGRRMTE